MHRASYNFERLRVGPQSLLLWSCVLFLLPSSSGPVHADDKRDPSVGAPGFIEQIVLPGTKLKGRAITEESPVVVRVVAVFPHGEHFRYDIQFSGLEPGPFNLAEYLVREDGSSVDDLPAIPVEIKSLLPPGQIQPNALETGWLPRLGGYRVLLYTAATLWFLVFLGLIFLGRGKPALKDKTPAKATLADLLQPRLEAAAANRLQPDQYAELERMLFAFWRGRLGLENEPADLALSKIHADPNSGPLMQQLEQWMHNPSAERNVDLAALLTPYRQLPADTPGFES